MKNLLRLIVLFVILQLSNSVLAYDFEVDGIYYNVVSLGDLTCEVTSGDKKYEGDIKIPSEVEYKSRTLSVIGIRSEAFYGCTSLVSVEAPNVTSIGDMTFISCTSLVSVEAPNVTSIGDEAFAGCTSLVSIEAPNVTSIEYRTFAGCTSLVSIEAPNVTSIGELAFYGCKSLVSIEAPNVTSIGELAFSQCTSLVSVEAPNVNSIGRLAFDECKSLKSVDFPKITSIGRSAFYECKSLKSVDFPKITSIGSGVFSGCSSLEILNLPNVTSIDGGALAGCGALESIIFPKLLTIEAPLFRNCISLKRLTIPGTLKRIIQFDTREDAYVSDIRTTFEYCSLKELYLEYGNDILQSVCKIGKTFYSVDFVTSLESVTFNTDNFSVKTSGSWLSVEKVFIDRKVHTGLYFENLKELTLGEHVTSIQVSIPSETLICLGKTPISISDKSFSNSAYLNLTVKVPKDALEAYQNAPGWRNFWNLQALEDSSFDDIISDSEVSVVGRYDLNGRAVSEDYKGITIVRYSDGSTRKMIAK